MKFGQFCQILSKFCIRPSIKHRTIEPFLHPSTKGPFIWALHEKLNLTSLLRDRAWGQQDKFVLNQSWSCHWVTTVYGIAKNFFVKKKVYYEGYFPALYKMKRDKMTKTVIFDQYLSLSVQSCLEVRFHQVL